MLHAISPTVRAAELSFLASVAAITPVAGFYGTHGQGGLKEGEER